MAKQEHRSWVFEGGSVKGAGHLGAVDALIQLKVIEISQIERIAGTSAGSIIAALLSVGYHHTDELRGLLVGEGAVDFIELIPTKDLFKLKDAKVAWKAPAGAGLFAETGKKTKQTGASSKGSTATTKILYQISKTGCLVDGEALRQFVEDRISEKVKALLTQKKTDQGTDYSGPADIESFSQYLTFAMLHELHVLYPNDFKDVYIVAYNLSEQRAVTFSYENPEFKDVVISDAVRMSSSIPFLFAPHTPHFRQVEAGQGPTRIPDPVCPLYIDGGVDKNLPIHIFDDYQYYSKQGEGQEGHFVNPETFAFSLVNTETKNYLKTGKQVVDDHYLGTASFLSIFQATLQAFAGKQKRAHIENPHDPERTVHIDTVGIGTLDIDLAEVDKWRLFESGRKAVFEMFAPDMEFSFHPENNYAKLIGRLAQQEAGPSANVTLSR